MLLTRSDEWSYRFLTKRVLDKMHFDQNVLGKTVTIKLDFVQDFGQNALRREEKRLIAF